MTLAVRKKAGRKKGKTYKRFDDLMASLPRERQQRIARQTKKKLLAMDLAGVRKLSGKTQKEVAELLNSTQGQVSLAESRGDHLVSTLRSYVSALGGELYVVADFGDKQIKLHSV